MRRRSLLRVSLATAASVAIACRRRASNSDRLLLATARRLTLSSLHLADESGYFREEGLELDIRPTGGPLVSMALVAGGKVDVYLGSIGTVFLNAVLKGAKVRIVAGREFASPTCGSIAAIYGLRKSFPSGLEDLSVLRGRRVACGPGTGWGEFALDSHLALAGMTSDDVELVRLTAAEAVAALLGGGIEAMLTTDELDRDPRMMIPDVIRTQSLGRLLPKFQFSYAYFGETLLSGAVDRGARFLRAYLRGAREFAQGRTPRFMVEYARSNNLPEAETIAACRDTFALDGAINLESLRLVSAWSHKKKYISRLPDVSELVDDRFLRRAHAS